MMRVLWLWARLTLSPLNFDLTMKDEIFSEGKKMRGFVLVIFVIVRAVAMKLDV